ncbi:MAG: efflux RND transporter periplasmic adaptor subunit, partial [Calditrichaeota bacterium]|nr:efflux RND transporter periplasmic adaptor subunit [Calditrichota bacterium]
AGLAYWGLAESPAEDSGAEMKYKEVTVTRGTFQEMVSANGIVRPIDRIEIKSKASGEIVALPVEQGDFVKKGDLIARLDQKDESAAVKQAEADLDIAKAELAQAQRSFERRDQLFQENLISEEERDQIELSLAVAKGKLVQASTTLERARERFSESVVRAPIDGVILQKYVEEGQIIASGVSNVSGGTAIVDIADMRSVYIEAGIDEIDIGKIRVGQAVAVEAEAYPQLKFRGSVIRIAPEAKIEQNVTLFDVIVEVENPEGKLKSGMNSTIEITIVNEENVLLVPAMAFQSANQAESRSG